MAKGWPGERKRHEMSARGIRTKRSNNQDLYFSSNGIVTEMLSLANMFGFGELFNKKEAKGYPEHSYNQDAQMIAILPSSKAEQSVVWLKYEYNKSKPVRQYQLVNLAKKTRTKISMELDKPSPAHVQDQLRKSRSLYNKFIMDVGGM